MIKIEKLNRRTVVTGLAASGAIAALAVRGAAKLSKAEITFDSSRHFQKMTGWEATGDLNDDPQNHPWNPFEEELLDRLISEVGINRIRLELRPGVEDTSGIARRFIEGKVDYESWKPHQNRVVNDNADPFVADPRGFDFAELDWHIENTVKPMQDRIASAGERLLINLCYVCFTDKRHLHMDAEEYAELVLQTYKHMESRWGFVPDSWEVILEPDNSYYWQGPVIGKVVAAAGRRLKQNGYRPAFVVPAVTDMRNAISFMKQIVAVPGAREYVSEFAYHRYRGSSTANVRRIARYAEQLGLKTSMLEYWFENATHHVLHEDLDIGNVSAWQASIVRGHHKVVENAGQQSLELYPYVRYLLPYFKSVRAGAVRVGAASTVPREFAPLGFINLDGSRVIIVKAATGGTVEVNGLPAGKYSTRFVSEGDDGNLGNLTVAAGGSTQVDIPDAGVLAIRGL